MHFCHIRWDLLTTSPLAFVKSSLLRLATLSAFLSVLLMKAGELSPAIAFCSSSVLARISSGLRPLAASSRCIAARIYRHKLSVSRISKESSLKRRAFLTAASSWLTNCAALGVLMLCCCAASDAKFCSNRCVDVVLLCSIWCIDVVLLCSIRYDVVLLCTI